MKIEIITDANQICRPTKTIHRLTVRITPAIAQRLLDQTGDDVQRPVNKRTVAMYANDMAHGKWAHNYESIQQDRDGNLLNGRHRCHACIQSGKDFVTEMVKGLNYAEVMDTIDTGKNRTKSDVLYIHRSDLKHIGTVSYAITFLHNFVKNRFAQDETRDMGLTNRQLREWVDSNDAAVTKLADYADIVSKYPALLPVKMSTGLYYIFAEINPAKAKLFFDQLLNGIGLQPDSPVLSIRNRLLKSKEVGRRDTKLTWRDKLILTIKAWNDYFTSGRITVEYYKSSDKEIPAIAGLPKNMALYVTPKGWDAK